FCRPLVRLRGALGDAADDPPHGAPDARDAARRKGSHRQLPELRPLERAAAGGVRPHAGIGDAALRVVRDAERAPLHHRRLRGPVPAPDRAHPRAPGAAQGGAGHVPAQLPRQPRRLSLHRRLMQCPPHVRAILAELGISTDLIETRGLPLCAEPDTLEIAEVGEDGREYRLTPDAAAAWRKMKAAAAAEGVTLRLISAF